MKITRHGARRVTAIDKIESDEPLKVIVEKHGNGQLVVNLRMEWAEDPQRTGQYVYEVRLDSQDFGALINGLFQQGMLNFPELMQPYLHRCAADIVALGTLAHGVLKAQKVDK